METAFFILLILVIWISLHGQIGKAISNTESLKKEIAELRKQLETARPKAEAVKPVPVEEKAEVKKQEVLFVPPKIERPSKPKKKPRQVNYEKYIGENLFGKIGILILVIGVGLFVKYAIDRDWINEVFRTVLGFATGVGLLVISGKLRKTYLTFSSLLAGGAFAVFYVTVAMAYHYYGLFSQASAFILLIIFTILVTVLSVLYNRRELAIIALIGGFISPFLVSDGMGSYMVLFVYVSILNLGMFGLSLYKKWGELPLICFAATYLILGGYIWTADLDIARSPQLVHLILFSTLFYLTFLLPVVSILNTGNNKISHLLLAEVSLNNFIYLFFCLYFFREMQPEQNLKGLFPLGIALVNGVIAFIVSRRSPENKILYPALTGLALTFVSIAVPVQLEGTFITLLWACELVIVLWLFTRFRMVIYEYFSIALLFLTNASYLMDMENAVTEGGVVPLFANGMFATGIFTGVALLVWCWLMNREKEMFQAVNVLKYSPFNAFVLLNGCAILYIAFILEFLLNVKDSHLSMELAQTFTAAALLALLLCLRKRFPVAVYSGCYAFGLFLSVCLYGICTFAYPDIQEQLAESLKWISFVIIAVHIWLFTKSYYAAYDFHQKISNPMTGLLSFLSTVLLVIGVNIFLKEVGYSGETSAGFSVSLIIAGFVEMSLGMRLHQKFLRMVSLLTFGIVLVKLILVDIWLLPTVGKIIIFIILGVILLILSFLYQKLKKVLFEADEKNDVIC